MSDFPARDPRAPRARPRRVALAGLALLLVGASVAGCAGGVAGQVDLAETSGPTTKPERPAPVVTPAPVIVPVFDKHARSIDDPASIWVVVDKLRPLTPADYAPSDLVDVPVAHTWDPLLRQEAADAVVAMFQAAAAEAGLTLASNSAYRSYSAQERVYGNEVASFGEAAADLSTARPGHSEHQTGLTMDIGAESGRCSIDPCFADTPEGQWLATNAHRFGFLLRYPADKTAVTGFEFEPWHYRFIGTELAAEMHTTGVTTLEEFFGLPAAPSYG